MINNRTDTQKTAVNLLKTWLRISKVTGTFEKGAPGHFYPSRSSSYIRSRTLVGTFNSLALLYKLSKCDTNDIAKSIFIWESYTYILISKFVYKSFAIIMKERCYLTLSVCRTHANLHVNVYLANKNHFTHKIKGNCQEHTCIAVLQDFELVCFIDSSVLGQFNCHL